MNIWGVVLITILSLPAQITIVPGDSTRGAALFVEKGCVQCHSFNGQGANTAPDLAQRPTETRSPSRMAAELWNHTPSMWARMKSADRAVPFMSSTDTADMFAYFYSQATGFRPGNPNKGLSIFERDCETCHTFGTTTGSKIDLLSKRAPQTAMGYAVAISRHRPLMNRAAGGKLPLLTEEDMNDVVSYLFEQRYFAESGNVARGAKVYINKGCASCHDAKTLGSNPDLTQATERFSPITMTSALWRSGPAMLRAIQQKNMEWPVFHGAEMTDLIAYLNQRLITRVGR
jgi:mono/diheme cytochrome c family protein